MNDVLTVMPELGRVTRKQESAPRFRYDTAVVGLGYVGLPTALALHAAGHRVLGLEISDARVRAVEAGDVDLLASDHSRLVEALGDQGRFDLVTDPLRLAHAETVLICVPTPIDHHLMPDLAPLVAACRTVVARAVPGQTLVLTSTTYVGCTRDLLVKPLHERGLVVGRDVFVTFAPERIDPGNDKQVQRQVPRVVGGVTDECVRRTRRVLEDCASFVHPVSSVEAAELTKLYENTFRAVNISMANEFADISRGLGLDVLEVIEAAATKPYGFMAFYPGPGVGGHCIPCDPHYLLWQLRAERVHAPLIDAAMQQVARRPGTVVKRATEVLAGQGKAARDAKILMLGVAYKPGVADLRESPALEIIERLREAGAEVSYTDDFIPSLVTARGELRRTEEPGNERWDLVVVHTLHPGVDLSWLRQVPVVLDTSYQLRDLPNRAVL